IAHGVGLPLGIASHQSGVHLFHLLGHKAELRDALAIKLVLVAEGHRLQREDCFARLVHRLDCILETLRRGRYAKLAVRTNRNRGSSDGYSRNAGNKGGRLTSFAPDLDPARPFTRPSPAVIDDSNVVIARLGICTGSTAYCDVSAARCVAKHCKSTDGRVAEAGYVAKERRLTNGRGPVAGRVAS